MLGILFIAALIGNIFPITLFPPGRILLAGIPVLMIVRLYGARWGSLAALLTPLFALALGHNPAPELVWVAEAAIIGILLRREIESLPLASLMFWILLALPVQYLVYGILLQYPQSDLIHLIGHTTLNGFANAVLACLALLALGRKGGLPQSTLPYLDVELNAIAGAFLLPVLMILVLNVSGPRDFFQPGLENELANRGRLIQNRINLFHAELAGALAGLTDAPNRRECLETRLIRLLQKEKRLQRISIYDTSGKMLLSRSNATATDAGADALQRLSGATLKQLAARTGPALLTFDSQSPKTGAALRLLCPLTDDGEPVGLVLAALEPQSYLDILASGENDALQALLVDDANRVVVSGSPDWHPSDLLTATLFDAGPNPRQLFVWNPHSERVSRIWPELTAEPGEPGVLTAPRLVLALPHAALHNHVHRLLLTSMALLLIPCLTALAMALRVRNKIVRPIKRLADAASDLPEKARSGNLPVWPPAPIAEILDLSGHCREAALALAASYAELEKIRRKSTDSLDNLLSQHRWEAFISSQKLQKTSHKLALEQNQRRRVQELIDNIDAAESRYRLLIENSLVGIFVYQDHGYTYVNPRFAEIFGYTPEEITSEEHPPELVHPDDQLLVSAHNLKLLNTPQTDHVHYEFAGVRKTGETVQVEALIGRGISEGQPALIGSLLDITERKNAEKTIEHLAFHDPLTNLPNRLLFLDRVEQNIARAQRTHESFALLFLDMDRFKTINDTLGHTAGDLVLKEVARRLESCLRNTDTVSRFGGDEFNILLPRAGNEEEIELIAHKVLKTLAWPFDIQDHEVFLTCSIGIGIFPKDGQHADLLVKNADTALYRAKDLGRNNFQFYSSSMNAQALERMAMESSLRRMFERQELRVHYQPQISLKDGRVTGLEGLVRWEHPVGNMISPSVFVPLAEETGLIIPMGDWVLQTGCYQLKTWLDAGFPSMRLGINVSPQQLQKSEFADLVMQILRECDLPPACLNLEITETVIMQDMHQALETLKKVRSVGVTISIDDFGTGFSSLSYLKDLPADHLKIDRSFVQNLPFSSNEAGIARHIIDMAHGLGLKVIAEGVENQAQLEFLREAGCDEIQGFLISRPLPAEEITDLLAQNKPLLEMDKRPSPG